MELETEIVEVGCSDFMAKFSQCIEIIFFRVYRIVQRRLDIEQTRAQTILNQVYPMVLVILKLDGSREARNTSKTFFLIYKKYL